MKLCGYRPAVRRRRTRAAWLAAVGLALLGWGALPAAAQSRGICGRTPLVRDKILGAIDNVTDCNLVTAAHLAAITSLNLSGGVTDSDVAINLAAGDLAGLSGLQTLRLDSADVRSVHARLFAGTPNLQSLDLGHNDLTSVPAGLFTGLSKLRILELDDNDLTSLPAGLFTGLYALTRLELDDNDVTAPSGGSVCRPGLPGHARPERQQARQHSRGAVPRPVRAARRRPQRHAR